MPGLTDREQGSTDRELHLQNFKFSSLAQTCPFETQNMICLLQYLKDIIS